MTKYVDTVIGPWPTDIISPDKLAEWYLEGPMDTFHRVICSSIIKLIRKLQKSEANFKQIGWLDPDTGRFYYLNKNERVPVHMIPVFTKEKENGKN